MYKQSNIIALLLAFFALSYQILPQSDNKIVAKAGNINIDAAELKSRMDLTPWPKGKKDINDQKTGMLYTLIAEKLLAQEALSRGLDTSYEFNETYKIIEKMYVRDALYKKEISSKTQVTPGLLNTAVARNRWLLKLDYIKFAGKEHKKEDFKNITAKSFDSLLSVYKEKEYQSLEVKFGDMDPDLEAELWSIEKGGITRPVKTQNQWLVFKVTDKTDRFLTNEKQKIALEAKQVIEKREREILFEKFHKSFFAGRKVETDGYLFRSLAERIINALKMKAERKDIEAKARIVLTYDDFRKISGELTADTLKMTFVKLDKRNIQLREFVNSLSFEEFTCPYKKAPDIKSVLDSRLKLYIENELLADEAYKRGFDKLPEVQRETDIWKQSYLAQLMKNNLYSSVKSEAGKGSTEKSSVSEAITKVNIFDITTDNLQNVEKIFNMFDKYPDPRKAADELSKDKSMNLTVKESGLVNAYELGEAGRIASSMEKGEIYGPLKKGNEFSVFKLLEKTTAKETKEGFDNAGGKSGSSDTFRDFYRQLSSETASIAGKYGVSINHDLLNSIPESGENIFSYRYMGFGGRIPAAPVTAPFTEWIQEWLKTHKDLP